MQKYLCSLKKAKQLKKNKKPDVLFTDSSFCDKDTVSYAESDKSFILGISDPKDNVIVPKDNIECGDQVLVSYKANKRRKHFVGQVVRTIDKKEIDVKFVKRFKDYFV